MIQNVMKRTIPKYEIAKVWLKLCMKAYTRVHVWIVI